MVDPPLPDEVEALAALPVYVTRREAWTFLRVSETTLRRMIESGELQHRRVGGRILIPRASIRAYLLGIDQDLAVIPELAT